MTDRDRAIAAQRELLNRLDGDLAGETVGRDSAGVPLDYPTPPAIESSLPEPSESPIVESAPAAMVDIDGTAVGGTTDAADADGATTTAADGAAPTSRIRAALATLRAKLGLAGRTPEAPTGVFGEGGDWYTVDEAKRKKTYRYLVIGGGALLVVALVAIFSYLQFGTATVPDLVGLTSAQAVAAIRDAGLSVGAIEERDTPGVTPGTVVDQHPDVDTVVAKGSEVAITVASASDSAAVPNLVGKTRAAAVAALASARLTEQVVTDYSETIPAGQVMAQVPVSRTVVAAGSSVAVIVSGGSGATQRQVPRVIGLGQETAIQALTDAGFTPRVFTARSDVGEVGSVAAQMPGSDQMANPGAVVLVLVNRAVTVSEREVPDLSSMTESQAATALTDTGAELEVAPFASDSVPAGTIVGQIPLAKRCTVVAGERVGVLVSVGSSDAVNAPSLVGTGLGAALEAVRAASLTPVVVLGANGENPAMTASVTQQYPAPGAVVRLGLPVVLFAELAASPTK